MGTSSSRDHLGHDRNAWEQLWTLHVQDANVAALVQKDWIGDLDACGHVWLDMAMKQVGVARLKDQLSQHLRAVEAGAELEVTDRGRPIARIVPVRRSRIVELRRPLRPFATVRDRRYTPANWGVSSTELLLQERQGR
jgi:prevent-host-death family protein